MVEMDGTLDHHWNTIVMSNFMYHQPMPFKMLTQSKFSYPYSVSSVTPEDYLSQSETEIIFILQSTP